MNHAFLVYNVSLHHYADRNKNVRHFSCQCQAHDILGIQGDASALFNVLSQRLVMAPTWKVTGHVHIPHPFIIKSIPKETQYMPDYLTVGELLHNYTHHIADWAVLDAVERFDLKEKCNVRFTSLSLLDQYFARLAILNLVCVDMIVLEDPFLGLTAKETFLLMTALKQLASEGLRFIIFYRHCRHDTLRLFTELIVIKNKVSVFYGRDWTNDIGTFLSVHHIECPAHLTPLDALEDHEFDAAHVDKRHAVRCQTRMPRKKSPQLCTLKAIRQLFSRYLKHVWRKRGHGLAQVTTTCVWSLLCVLLFRHISIDAPVVHVHFIFFMLALHTFIVLGLIPSLCVEECIFHEDMRHQLYSPLMYSAVRLGVDLCVDVCFSILLTTAVCAPLHYWGLLHGGYVFMYVWGIVIRCVSSAYITAMVATMYHLGTRAVFSIVLSTLLLQFFSCGIVVSTRSMSWPFQVLHDMSFSTQALTSIVLKLKDVYPVRADNVLKDYDVAPGSPDRGLEKTALLIGTLQAFVFAVRCPKQLVSTACMCVSMAFLSAFVFFPI